MIITITISNAPVYKAGIDPGLFMIIKLFFPGIPVFYFMCYHETGSLFNF